MVDSRFVDTTLGPIHVRTHRRDGHRTCLMVHGLGGASHNWEPIAAHLTDTVVALDLPGFGLSPPQPGNPLRNHVEVVSDLVESITGPLTLVGNSMGGMVAEEVAGRARIESLILLAPATPLPIGTMPADVAVAGRLLLQGLPIIGPAATKLMAESGTPAQQVRRTLEIIAAEPGSIAPEFFEASVRLAEQRRTMPWTYDSFSASARAIGRRLVDVRRFTAMIDQIEAPTLLLWGDQDRVVTPAALRRLAARRPDWRAVELAGVGHVPMLEAPATTADIMRDWLAERPMRAVSSG